MSKHYEIANRKHLAETITRSKNNLCFREIISFSQDYKNLIVNTQT